MSQTPLMPKATAVWLVDNTSLTFNQIANFCGLHALEVKAIADGDSSAGIKGLDPIATGQLTREDINEAQNDAKIQLKLAKQKTIVAKSKKKGPRYTPISKRQDRPNAILWLLRNHPELKDSQIIRLVGTTRTTITAIKEGAHWNSQNLTPTDPVTLGICTQIDLDFEVNKAAKDKPEAEEDTSPTLLSTEETVQKEIIKDEDVFAKTPEQPKEEENMPDADTVFAKLKDIKL